MSDLLVVGGGVFGATAAWELRRRGHNVVLLEAGKMPNPLAASTDISKVVRMEYGTDEDYMQLGEEAREGWLEWNERARRSDEDALYHETGVAMFCRSDMRTGGFENDSFETLIRRGHVPERVAGGSVLERFPAWNPDLFVDGFFHAKGGYAESGRTISMLAKWLREAAVDVVENMPVARLVLKGGRVTGVEAGDGSIYHADAVIVAAGAWTSKLVPALETSICPTGHPVFHLRPHEPDLFRAQRFPTFTSDVAETGYYGFPLNRDGVVKVGVHALGRQIDADDERAVATEQVSRLREFLAVAFPSLADDPIVYTRLCLYADTPDEHFWIARHPDVDGLTIASGGSGHGFKFAPVLGNMIANAAEGTSFRLEQKFRWRSNLNVEVGQEAARCHRVV